MKKPYKRDHDLIGQKFGRLTVVSQASTTGDKYKLWSCLCDCGKTTIKTTTALTLRNTRSCGCLQKELTSAARKTHGEGGRGLRTVEYEAYIKAKMRCNNPKDSSYKNYGARGIKFLFDSYEEFLTEVGRRPGRGYSLDRINNNGHYEKGNLRWATRVEQVRNTRQKRIENFSLEELETEILRRRMV